MSPWLEVMLGYLVPSRENATTQTRDFGVHIRFVVLLMVYMVLLD